MPDNLPPPLGGPPPAEVPLSRSPLVRVLAQASLPGILKISVREEAAKFQEQLRRDYPLFDEESTLELRIGIGAPSVQQQASTAVWRFSDAARNWRVSLAPHSISLEAMKYTSRDEFLARLRTILEQVEAQFAPQITPRIGLRYLDQVSGDALARITKLVRPSMLGLTGDETRPYIQHAISEAQMDVEEGKVMLRWGMLPPNVVIDPGLMTGKPEQTWVLDIDAFDASNRTFDHTALSEAFTALAHRTYAVFRYVVTDDFLRFFGGEI